jgi:SAM-dependent methyltransferase
MGWEQAGVAWGYRATDWAYLMEPLFARVYDRLAEASGMASGTRVLDVGCGAGAGAARYARSGASVAGLDAAAPLLSIARERNPEQDLRHGTMTALPWDADSFDVVTGVNSFVYADDGALTEAHRVLADDGLLCLAFFRDPQDFGPCMAELGAARASHVEPEQTHTPLQMADPGVRTALLERAGFRVVDEGELVGTSEFPDVNTAYRALAAAGNMYPVTEAGEEPALRERCEPLLASLMSPGLGIRMRATFGWATAAPD